MAPPKVYGPLPLFTGLLLDAVSLPNGNAGDSEAQETSEYADHRDDHVVLSSEHALEHHVNLVWLLLLSGLFGRV